jgi:hypothetical protein
MLCPPSAPSSPLTIEFTPLAIGTLIALGKSETIEDAQKLMKSIRSVVSIR